MSAPSLYIRKWTGSPKNLQRKARKQIMKHKQLVCSDVENLSDHIFFGWHFSCNCGVSGHNYVDRHRSLQCDVCKVWMHNLCNNVPVRFHDVTVFFSKKKVWVCQNCQRGNFRYGAEHWRSPEVQRKQTVSFKEEIQTVHTLRR